MANYFSHDSNARNDEKLIRLRMRHKAAGYGVYFMILERLREEKNYMSVKDYNMIAFDLREDAALIKSVVEEFGLFEFCEIDGKKFFYSESFLDRMSHKDELSRKRSEAGKIGIAKRLGLSLYGNEEDAECEVVLDRSKIRSIRMTEARKKGTHTKEQWEELKNFFGECVICGSKENLQKDHIIPIYQGGSDGLDNLQPLCRSCNCSKGRNSHDYRIDWCKAHGVEMPEMYKMSKMYEMHKLDIFDVSEMSKDVRKERKEPKEIKENKEKQSKENSALTRDEEFLKRFLSNQGEIETMLMKHHIDRKTLDAMTDDILNEWKLTEQLHLNYNDFARHLVNTIRIKVREAGKGVNPKQEELRQAASIRQKESDSLMKRLDDMRKNSVSYQEAKNSEEYRRAMEEA